MYQELKDKFESLEKKLADPENMKDQAVLLKLSKEHASLKKGLDLILEIEKIEKELEENQALLNDDDFKDLALSEIEKLNIQLTSLKEDLDELLNPSNPNDLRNAIIEIRAGAGGDEAALFAADLSQMYLRFCEQNNFKTEIISSSTIGIGGFKEIIFEIKGEGAYGLFKYEAGTHRVQRVPSTEKQGRVHTSTITVNVLPEAQEIDIKIENNDLRIDTFCSSGPGGQSVNTTYSAIRITHLPTGLTASCQDQKSQHQNKEKALQILRSRLLAKEEEERMNKESKTRKDQVGGGDRSDKIRTYNFPQDRITDHRINQSWHNISDILEGDLADILNSLKKGLKI